MDEERFAVYLDSLEPDSPAPFAALEEEARKRSIPILRPGTASLLSLLASLQKPGRILEIGTAIGCSGLRLLSAAPNAHLTTVELDEARAAEARTHFSEAGVTERVTLLTGDAGELLQTLSGPFELIFLDGPKGQYEVYLPELIRLLATGGLLFTDNVLQEGRLLDPRGAVIRRDRTIHERLRRFVHTLYRDERFICTLLPLEDGVLLSYKREENL